MVYIIILFLYNNVVYIYVSVEKNEDGTDNNPYSMFLLLGVVYPALYEFVQMLKVGPSDYLSDMGNYIDLIYIWGSIAMTFVHIELTPYHWISKSIMCMVALLAIRRTFNFLRIFTALSPIVTMLSNVIWALRIFMTFYTVLMVLFSLMFGVLGIQNYKLEGNYRNEFWTIPEGGDDYELSEEAPGQEYKKIGLFFGNIFTAVRVSMGDFPIIDSAEWLSPAENIMFWCIWLMTTVVTAIIFLNFIVAEAGNSYNEVSEQLENFIQQQRAALVSEAESLLPNFMKGESSFP